jgi:hypothetical protein
VFCYAVATGPKQVAELLRDIDVYILVVTLKSMPTQLQKEFWSHFSTLPGEEHEEVRRYMPHLSSDNREEGYRIAWAFFNKASNEGEI